MGGQPDAQNAEGDGAEDRVVPLLGDQITVASSRGYHFGISMGIIYIYILIIVKVI